MPTNAGISTTMRPFEWMLLLFLSLLWGGSFFFNAIAVDALPVMTIVLARVGGAALILLLIMRLQQQVLPLGQGLWRDFLVMGFLNNVVPFCAFVWAQQFIGGGLAAIMNASTPLITAIVAHFLTRDEKLSGLRFVGVVIGLFGVAVMIGLDAFSGSLTDQLWGQLACVLAALSYAFAGVWGRRFKVKGITPMASATGQVGASTLLLLPIVLFLDQPWSLSMPGIEVWLALAGIASLSTALAYLIYFRILASAGATNIVLVTFLVPVSAVLLGVAFLGEVLEGHHLTGMAIIGLGLAAIDGRPIRYLLARKA